MTLDVVTMKSGCYCSLLQMCASASVCVCNIYLVPVLPELSSYWTSSGCSSAAAADVHFSKCLGFQTKLKQIAALCKCMLCSVLCALGIYALFMCTALFHISLVPYFRLNDADAPNRYCQLWRAEKSDKQKKCAISTSFTWNKCT